MQRLKEHTKSTLQAQHQALERQSKMIYTPSGMHRGEEQSRKTPFRLSSLAALTPFSVFVLLCLACRILLAFSSCFISQCVLKIHALKTSPSSPKPPACLFILFYFIYLWQLVVVPPEESFSLQILSHP